MDRLTLFLFGMLYSIIGPGFISILILLSLISGLIDLSVGSALSLYVTVIYTFLGFSGLVATTASAIMGASYSYLSRNGTASDFLQLIAEDYDLVNRRENLKKYICEFFNKYSGPKYHTLNSFIDRYIIFYQYMASKFDCAAEVIINLGIKTKPVFSRFYVFKKIIEIYEVLTHMHDDGLDYLPFHGQSPDMSEIDKKIINNSINEIMGTQSNYIMKNLNTDSFPSFDEVMNKQFTKFTPDQKKQIDEMTLKLMNDFLGSCGK